jgi:diacylglycerol O-acyltransferase / wax synthase
VADPLERVRIVHEAMVAAKAQFEMVPADALVDLAQFSSPALAAQAARLASSLRIADRTNPPVNVVISNVPGPRQPLYLAGAELVHYYPVSTIAEGMGLNITVHSYLDTLDIGLVSCRELVPDLELLIDLHVEEVQVLFEALGLKQAAPPARVKAAPRPEGAPRRKAAPRAKAVRRDGAGRARRTA